MTIDTKRHLSLSFYNMANSSTKLLLYPFKCNHIGILNCIM